MSGRAKSREQTWLASGVYLWERTYRLHGHDDVYAFDAIRDMLEAGKCPPGAEHLIEQKLGFLTVLADGLWSAKWVDGGCRMLECDARFGAALAATRADAEALGELHIAWPAFLVRLPPQLFLAPDGTHGAYLSHVRCMQLRGRQASRAWVMFHELDSGDPVVLDQTKDTLVDALLTDPDGDLELMQDELGGTRSHPREWVHVVHFAKRCVVGLLYALEHTNNWRQGRERSGKLAGASRDGCLPPMHRSIVFGAPIRVDVSAAVREACRDGLHVPAFQTLVRGHLKRQVIGVGRTGRKVIWVEPYWRGPEEAPILARPYRVGGPQA